MMMPSVFAGFGKPLTPVAEIAERRDPEATADERPQSWNNAFCIMPVCCRRDIDRQREAVFGYGRRRVTGAVAFFASAWAELAEVPRAQRVECKRRWRRSPPVRGQRQRAGGRSGLGRQDVTGYGEPSDSAQMGPYPADSPAAWAIASRLIALHAISGIVGIPIL
jgi:hypothetical protein